MRRLWHDIREHPFSAVLFLGYWLAFWVMNWSLGWSSGIPGVGMIFGLSAPVIAAGLVGWWRAPTREGLLVERRQLAGGPLAAVLVILVDIALVFAPDWVRNIQGGAWEWSAVVELLGVSVVFGLPYIGLGWLSARVGAGLARKARAGTTR
jgi:hypothetical protein